MENKKIGIISIILIGILMLAVGIGAGYLISKSLVKNDQVVNQEEDDSIDEIRERKLKNAQNQEKITPIVDLDGKIKEKTNTDDNSTPDYIDTESVAIDGTKYTVGYVNKVYKRKYEDDGQTATYDAIRTTIYVNDKAIKMIDNVTYFEDNDYKDLVTLNVISDKNIKDKKYLVITVKAPAASDENNYIIIVDTNGDVIGTILGHYANDGVVTNDNKDNNYSQIQINTNSIALFERLNEAKGTAQNYVAAKYVVQVDNGVIWKNLEKVYTAQEAQLAGR